MNRACDKFLACSCFTRDQNCGIRRRYRVYDEGILRRLGFIKQAQSLGFSLDEIRRIVALRGRGKETCRCVLGMAGATLTETQRKLDELQRFHNALAERLARWKKQSKSGNELAAEFRALIQSSAGSKE